MSNIHGHVRAQLKEVRKGWFNLDKMSNEVYQFSKLKKFFWRLSAPKKHISDLIEAEIRRTADASILVGVAPRGRLERTIQELLDEGSR